MGDEEGREPAEGVGKVARGHVSKKGSQSPPPREAGVSATWEPWAVLKTLAAV